MRSKRLALLVASKSAEAAMIPVMMAATAAAIDYECKLFYAFSGLDLLASEPDISALDAGQKGQFLMLRQACIEQGVELIACSASLQMQRVTVDQLVPGANVAGMATWLSFASGAEIQLNF